MLPPNEPASKKPWLTAFNTLPGYASVGCVLSIIITTVLFVLDKVSFPAFGVICLVGGIATLFSLDYVEEAMDHLPKKTDEALLENPCSLMKQTDRQNNAPTQCEHYDEPHTKEAKSPPLSSKTQPSSSQL